MFCPWPSSKGGGDAICLLEGSMQYLVVVRPFGAWRTGDLIADLPSVERVLGSEHAGHVVWVRLPGEEG